MSDVEITVWFRRKSGMNRVIYTLCQILVYFDFNKVLGNNFLFFNLVFHILWVTHKSLPDSLPSGFLLLLFQLSSIIAQNRGLNKMNPLLSLDSFRLKFIASRFFACSLFLVNLIKKTLRYNGDVMKVILSHAKIIARFSQMIVVLISLREYFNRFG